MRLISKLSLSVTSLFFAFSGCVNAIANLTSSFIAAIMTPGEMLEYGKRSYDKKVLKFSEDDYIGQGLLTWEKCVVEKYAAKKGSFLVLGSGGGREAIALAKSGFRVTGIDSSKDMVEMAKANAGKAGVDADFSVGDFMEPPLSGGRFDYCMLSCSMYSAIPSRGMRVKVLRAMRDMLKEDGLAIVHFLLDPTRKKERLFKLRKFVAKMTGGNVGYLPGDGFIPGIHFLRDFTDEAEVVGEAEEAGFFVKDMGNDSGRARYAVFARSS